MDLPTGPEPVVVRTFGHDLHAIAGRKNHGFADFRPPDQRGQRVTQNVAVEREAFANLDRSSFVAKSDQRELHY